MQRLSDWPTRLHAFLAASRSRAFAYGDWDCFQFMRGAVLAMTGVDLMTMTGFRPYRSRIGYLFQMRRFAETLSIVAFAEELLSGYGCEEVSMERASRGDVVLVGETQPAFGVIALDGRHALALEPAGAIVAMPLHSIIAAWKI